MQAITIMYVFSIIIFARTDFCLHLIHRKVCVKQQIMEIIQVQITLVAACLEYSMQFWDTSLLGKKPKLQTIQRAAKMILWLKRLTYEKR